MRLPLHVWMGVSHASVLALAILGPLAVLLAGHPEVWAAVGPGFALTLVATALATAGLSLASSHILSRSLRALSRASHRIAEGSLSAVAELARPSRSHVVEVGELAGDMRVMAERLQARLAYISEFAGNVSHEFKTPITTLRGTVELLADDADMPPAQQAVFLRNALTDLERMERMVSGLLALARAEEGGAKGAVDLDARIAAVAARRVGLSIAGAAGSVQGDGAQIEAALDNLVANAQRYGENVQIQGWREVERVGIDVVDDGPGISPGNLPRVFDRFFTTDRGRGGAGLGLALVRTVCRAHGGDVDVDTRPGRTRFRMWVAI